MASPIMGMNTIMFRLKAMPLAARGAVPMRPTIIMKRAKPRISTEYWSPVGSPKRTKRTKSFGSRRQPAQGAELERCVRFRMMTR